jgi:integrase
VKAIRQVLTEDSKMREAEGFFLACHVGLRASDLLKLTFEDMEKREVNLSEDKTSKIRIFPVTDIMAESVKTLKKWYKSQNIDPIYLFQATGNRAVGKAKPISQSYYYRKINDAIDKLGIDGNFGTHTARKTFGYHLYQKTDDIALIQKILNHASSEETLNYIGVTRKKIEQAYWLLDFSL